MSIASVTGFVTAALTLAAIALGILLIAVCVSAFQFFADNRPVRKARQEPVVAYYRHLAFG